MFLHPKLYFWNSISYLHPNGPCGNEDINEHHSDTFVMGEIDFNFQMKHKIIVNSNLSALFKVVILKKVPEMGVHLSGSHP